MTNSFNWTSTFGSSQDPGIERRDRETLEREKEIQRLIEAEKEEEEILIDNAERIRQKDLQENPPLEDLEFQGIETKPEHWLLRSLGWIGDRFDDVDRAAGIGEFNVYNARQKILKPLTETHVALGILGEFFVPDTIDIATLGLSYIPKRFAKLPKVWAKLTKAMNGDAARAILRGDDMLVDAATGMRIKAGDFSGIDDFAKQSAQPLMSKGSSNVGGASKRYNWRDIKGNKLWKSGKPDPKVTSKVDSILAMMDDWRLSHSDLERPMTGFVKHYGRKPTFWQDGKEWGIGWSRKKNNYEIFDVQARIDSRASRLAGDKTSSGYSYRLRQIKEAFKRDLNKQAKELPVEQLDIMIQNPGDAYIEHLIAIKSPFWKSQRGKNAGYLAGDSKNLKPLTDQNFKALKDNVEKHVHKNYKDLYVDYDPKTQNIILRNLETGKALDTQIPGIGDPTKAKDYVTDALAAKPMQSIETINPKTPPNVHRQIQKAYFADLDDITANAIIDRIKGDSWTEIRNTYGKDFSKRQLSLATDKYNKLTKSQVMAIMKAYNIGGKGKPGTY